MNFDIIIVERRLDVGFCGQSHWPFTIRQPDFDLPRHTMVFAKSPISQTYTDAKAKSFPSHKGP